VEEENVKRPDPISLEEAQHSSLSERSLETLPVSSVGGRLEWNIDRVELLLLGCLLSLSKLLAIHLPPFEHVQKAESCRWAQSSSPLLAENPSLEGPTYRLLLPEVLHGNGLVAIRKLQRCAQSDEGRRHQREEDLAAGGEVSLSPRYFLHRLSQHVVDLLLLKHALLDASLLVLVELDVLTWLLGVVDLLDHLGQLRINGGGRNGREPRKLRNLTR